MQFRFSNYPEEYDKGDWLPFSENWFTFEEVELEPCSLAKELVLFGEIRERYCKNIIDLAISIIFCVLE
jgi:hypothetical protein